MAKIRAYRLAEELQIDKEEFVEKVRTLGIELKSATAALTDEEADQVRAKLGSDDSPKPAMDEKRLERKGGAAVIRRRKRAKEPEPEPVPEPVAVDELAEPVVAEVADSGADAVEPVAAEGEPVAAVEGEEQPVAADATTEPEAASPGGVAATDGGEARKDSPKGTPATPTPAGGADRKGKQRKRVREVVNLKEREQFGRQITSGRGPQRRVAASAGPAVNPRRRRRDKPAPLAAAKTSDSLKRVVQVNGEISVGELAKLAGVKAPIVQGKLMALGIMVSVNQHVDVETCQKVATELGFEIQDTGFKETEFIEAPEEAATREDAQLEKRSPIVTVMGHVDHGKTSILDALRKANVADREAGGITQHIGAYQVQSSHGPLTFIDTPGHAAFTEMRARGASVTDLVVLVVAANDGVMPQTVEAIEHCRAAGCPIVVAVNKCDLPEADPKKTRQRLMEHNVVSEEFGGDVICVNVSAKTGEGLDQLLEMLGLQAEVLELQADSSLPARGVVLEAELDKGRGPLATVLVQSGTLRRGDTVVVGTEWGRVRLMEDWDGNRLMEVGPSMPVRVLGLSGVPSVGALLDAVENERSAKSIIDHRESIERGKPTRTRPRLSLEDFFAQADAEQAKELRVVLKADVGGTCEAVKDALDKLSTDSVELKVLSSGIGGISENDVMLASASEAIVVGFNVRPDSAAQRAADDHGVEIRTYNIIMNLLDDVRSAMVGLLPPTIREVALGRAEVRESFVIPKIGTIAGCMVIEGKVKRNANCRLVRDGIQVYEGRVGSLRRFKDNVAEVANGFECGIGIEGYNDVKIGDIIEAYELAEEAPTL